ncbi:MAG: hypothetical protein IJU87_04480 [Lachnospiraceae bacterium]|nr:hypothetical protein [Lachnospiraceae bacterium]
MQRYIGQSDVYSFNHYLYGEPYLGSFEGMRFRLGREPMKNVFFLPKEEQAKDGENEAYFLATVWPEPWCYEKRDPEAAKEERFPFSEEGFDQAVDWIIEQHDSGEIKSGK